MRKVIRVVCKYNAFFFIVGILIAGFISFNGSPNKSFDGIYALNSIYVLLFFLSIIDTVLKNKGAKVSLSGFVIFGIIMIGTNWFSCRYDGLPVVVFKVAFCGFFASLIIAGILYNFYPDSKKEDQKVV
ncbi:MAG: hypothetical protein WC242_00400 [Candidatus Paceibacterota bacterium]